LISLLSVAACADDGGPRLDAVVPVAAMRGELVTITGRRLCGASGDCRRVSGAVLLGLAFPSVRAGVVSHDDTAIAIEIPGVAPVGPTELVVTIDERSSNALDFEVLP
jgi:hypothetical protein